MQFVLFNGPPGCGKDTAAMAIYNHFWKGNSRTNLRYSVKWEKFSMPHKMAFAKMMGVDVDTFGNVHFFEERKSDIVHEFGVSYRQWQIDFSEKFMKPVYGKDIFVKLLLGRVALRLPTSGYLCVISDCGFQIEVDTFVKSVFPEQVLLVRLLRPGQTFSGDSRNYIEAPDGVKLVEYKNQHSLEDFQFDMIKLVEEWLHASSAPAISNAQLTNDRLVPRYVDEGGDKK